MWFPENTLAIAAHSDKSGFSYMLCSRESNAKKVLDFSETVLATPAL